MLNIQILGFVVSTKRYVTSVSRSLIFVSVFTARSKVYPPLGRSQKLEATDDNSYVFSEPFYTLTGTDAVTRTTVTETKRFNNMFTPGQISAFQDSLLRPPHRASCVSSEGGQKRRVLSGLTEVSASCPLGTVPQGAD
jgi:hypothetical protein